MAEKGKRKQNGDFEESRGKIAKHQVILKGREKERLERERELQAIIEERERELQAIIEECERERLERERERLERERERLERERELQAIIEERERERQEEQQKHKKELADLQALFVDNAGLASS